MEDKYLTLKCEYCGKEITLLKSVYKVRTKESKVRFCSRECMGLANRKRYTEKCKHCNKEFETTRNKFCSRKCVCEYRKAHPLKPKTIYEENGYLVKYVNGYNKKGNAKIHRLIIEEHLGRKLKSFEVVHHINGNKKDNRIENLQVMLHGEHSRLHRQKEIQEGKRLFECKEIV